MQSFPRVSKVSFGLAILSIFTAIGCGTGGSGSITPTPLSGNFSDSTLSGSYVYEIHGWASSDGVNFFPYRQVGVFTADGNGHITAGSDDSSLGANKTGITGSYNVVGDGTGSISLNTSSLGGALNFAITVASSSKVQMIENDTGLNAGGTAELQDSGALGATPSGTFVFRLHQEASAQSSAEGASQVGAFTLGGGAGSGAMDQNLNGTFTSPAVNVALNTPVSAGRGTGTLTDTSAVFTTDFTYYIVNGNKFVLLVTGGSAVGGGSAELQNGISAGAGLSGAYAFGSRGDDASTGVGGVATVGQLTATSGSFSGTEDLMQDGNYTASQNFTSCFTAGAAGGINGRVAAIANGSGACTGTPSQVFWMVSPSRAFFLDNSGTTLEDGSADLQTTNSFSAATFKSQFALGMDGLDLNTGQLLSRVGALNLDGTSKATLSEDASGSVSGVNQPVLSGSYSTNSAGRVVVTLPNGPLNLVMYAVSGAQAYVLEQDLGLITSGTVLVQQ